MSAEFELFGFAEVRVRELKSSKLCDERCSTCCAARALQEALKALISQCEEKAFEAWRSVGDRGGLLYEEYQTRALYANTCPQSFSQVF